MLQVVRHWDGFPGEEVECPSLGLLGAWLSISLVSLSGLRWPCLERWLHPNGLQVPSSLSCAASQGCGLGAALGLRVFSNLSDSVILCV